MHKQSITQNPQTPKRDIKMQNQTNQTERDYAKEQAIAQVQSIQEMVGAWQFDQWDRLEELQDAEQLTDEEAEELAELQEIAAGYTISDEALEAIQDHPLSIEYRSGWTPVGDDLTPDEFRVVLCTGGPHVEIQGEFDYNGGIDRVRVIYKDWGTSGELFDFDRTAVMQYCELVGVGCL